MKDPRPVFLDLLAIRLPIPAVVSILHRISGAFLFMASFYLLFLLCRSFSSSESFEQLKSDLASPFHAILLFLTLSVLAYHLVAGIRHLLMDLHVGESLKAGRAGAVLVLVATLVLAALSGLWIWL